MGDDYYGYEDSTEEGRGEKGGSAEEGSCSQEGGQEGCEEEEVILLFCEKSGAGSARVRRLFHFEACPFRLPDQAFHAEAETTHVAAARLTPPAV
jgi:hypothetical protein